MSRDARHRFYYPRPCVMCGRWFKVSRRDATICGTGCRKAKSRGKAPDAKPQPIPDIWRLYVDDKGEPVGYMLSGD